MKKTPWHRSIPVALGFGGLALVCVLLLHIWEVYALGPYKPDSLDLQFIFGEFQVQDMLKTWTPSDISFLKTTLLLDVVLIASYSIALWITIQNFIQCGRITTSKLYWLPCLTAAFDLSENLMEYLLLSGHTALAVFATTLSVAKWLSLWACFGIVIGARLQTPAALKVALASPSGASQHAS